MRRRLKFLPLIPLLPLEILIGLYFILFAGSFIFGLRAGDPEKFLDPVRVASLVIRDRSGTELRDTPSAASDSRARWVELKDVSDNFIKAIIAAEDSRFYSHSGIDPLAVGRAAVQNLAAGKIVSGGSTITMQVVKTARGGEKPRTLGKKLIEAAGAIYLERHLSKERILESYVNWVTFGNLTRGVEAASRLYFGKPAAHMSLSEATALAALLKAPTSMNPYIHPERLEKRRAWILGRMIEQGMVCRKDRDYSLKHPPLYQPSHHPFLAPHLVDEVLEKAGQEKFAAGEITTTIDKRLQEESQHLAAKMIEKVRHLDITNAAVVVIDNRTAEILAYVGSSSYFDEKREGMNDGVMARRSPGSTLKPFIYGAAMEGGLLPSEVIADIDTSFETPIGIYKPHNYDGLYHGPVRARVALGSSYNVPAVKLVSKLTPARILGVLRQAGFASLDKEPDYYGVAIAVGDGEVSLFELASGYSAIARGGAWKQPTFIKSVTDASGQDVALPARQEKVVFGPRASYLLADILSDPAARSPAFGKAEIFDFPFPVAVKTGTSNDYRDNWTVGFSSEVTVGVWVGNFSGKPMGNVSGITGAGPLFYQVMKAAMKGREGKAFHRPPGIVEKKVCALSGELAGDHCSRVYMEKFIEGKEPAGVCSYHIAGKDGAVIERYPEELIPWAVTNGKYLPSAYGPGAIAARAGDDAAWPGGPPQIMAPSDGAKYVINPDVPQQHQKLKVQVSAQGDDEKIRLYVDGKMAEEIGRPFIFTWTLKEGEHTLVAEGKSGKSSPVAIVVY